MGDSEELYPRVSTVYGPVDSWRLGLSLGIDLLFVNSICSFRCIYCQLGKINLHTGDRRVYVPTDQVVADLKKSDWPSADVVTFSGSGEPTLAANLGDVINAVKEITEKEVIVLTNAAHLDDEQVVSDLMFADRVFCKLDAADETGFERINRPVEGLTLRSIVKSIAEFKRRYEGILGIQTMYQPFSPEQISSLVAFLNEIGPDEVQINTPSRAIPREWFIEARGNYETTPYPAVQPRIVSREELEALREALGRKTRFPVVTRYS